MMLRPENDSAVVLVRDRGSGIKPERLSSIFEFFSLADDGNGRVVRGLGIGLAQAKTLVEMYGGTVMAHSDGLGCRTSLTVRLPLF